jgi:hypothetical protein
LIPRSSVMRVPICVLLMIYKLEKLHHSHLIPVEDLLQSPNFFSMNNRH